MVCPHCPSRLVTKEELDLYQSYGYFEGMKVGDLIYAQSVCQCYFEDIQDCDCKRADLEGRLARHENVKVCQEHKRTMLQLCYPEVMLVLVEKEKCEICSKR